MLPSDIKKNTVKRDNLAKISNSLIEAFVKKNNLGALKILFYISKSNLVLKEDVLCSIDLDIKDLSKYCNIDVKTLRRNISQMQETSITFVSYKDIEGDVSPSVEVEENITVVPYSKFTYGGKLEIKMFSKVLSLVSEVQNRFTVIDLENLMNLKSKHSVRMIQLLEMIEGFSSDVAKRKTYTLFELNSMFGTNYLRLKEFERKILVPVKSELDHMSSLSFVYQVNFDKDSSLKAGRPGAVSVTVDLVSNRVRQLKMF